MAHVTVPDYQTTVQYALTGTPSTTFTIPTNFTFFSETEDIRFYLDDTELTITTDFTVSGNGGTTGGFEGGTITMAGAYSGGLSTSDGTTVTIQLDIPIKRTTDFPTSGEFPIDTLNTDLDRIIRILKQVETKADGGFDFAVTSTAGASTNIPDPEANKLLGWNSSATALENKTVSDASALVTSAFIDTLLDDSSASEARTTLGVVIGTDVQAYDADTLKADTSDNLTVGFTNTAHDYGTITTGTVTVDFTEAAQAYYTNGGAHTLAPDSGVEGGQDILITNNASAGSITTSGFDDVVGDSFDTTDGNRFLAQVRRINGRDILLIAALQ